MPLFLVACRACGADGELLASSVDGAACTQCGSRDVTRLLGSFAARSGESAEAEAVSCGAPSCCRMAGGPCEN